ncbi:cAMP-binding domain of CRP or a regulatory subunit of cAMP-dependent protein kinases [Dethiosulfatibacter aminovorans DSM 17477]|uniref:cAMP-binding domain of CRP or a regulatory subunit of cAMP-dependent protein kinases n=1 Tax=Dethiosulfatibacter aminovorans DSM 17477 TaxID=1121476 RepID=A0A1M6LZZ0_9FIRM|nr:Crp/Fnr family transcriptional regulator [Dethiosulfatibacter aminovorans]SHJ76758.1 cAMP-binding domain of CRP or a regulatory subunit of cAMP-dependent protein kinases [Dethiosulfatibacter aminovorans DSM 17477]
MYNPKIETYRKEIYKCFYDKGKTLNFKKNSTIDNSHSVSKYVYLVKSGCIKQSIIDYDGYERTLLLLKKGDLFGEITYFCGDDNKVITNSFTNSEIEEIPISVFDEIISQHSSVNYYINLMISNKFRILLAQLQDSSFRNVEERLINLLIRLSYQHGEETNNGIKITHQFTHEDLAQMISSTRSTVSRKLKILEKKGIIEINKNITVKVPDLY